MAIEKNLIFPIGYSGLPMTFRIQRVSDNFWLDNSDGIFRSVPSIYDIPYSTETNGTYFLNEARSSWQPNASAPETFACFAYNGTKVLGQGILIVHYDNGTSLLETVKTATNSDIGIEIVEQNLPFWNEFNSIAERDNIAVVTSGTDIWQGTATTIPIPNQSVGEQISVVSSSTADSSGSSGISLIEIHYLNNEGYERSEYITLNGTSTVSTTATNIRFIQKMYSMGSTSAGSSAFPVANGNIICHKVGDPSTVYDIIMAGTNASLSSLRMVPKGKKFYLTNFSASSGGKQRVVVKLRSTDHHGDIIPYIFTFKETLNLENSAHTYHYPVPIVVPELSMIKVTAWTTAPGGAYVSAHYSGYLKNT